MSPKPVLLVGSVPLGSATEVFETTSRRLSGRLRCIPDGETAHRSNFIAWQHGVFPISIVQPRWGGQPTPESLSKNYSASDLKPTGYDDEAIESYATFRKLRDSGTIPQDVKFQVCLPTPLSVVKGFVETDDLAAKVEPLYRKHLLRALRRIQDNILASDLSIQFDMPNEVAALECESGRLKDPHWTPYFSLAKEGVIERLKPLVSEVDQDVDLGFHLCYGDLGHVHFIQPLDSALLVDFANTLVKEFKGVHAIKYIHIPVPRDRTDVEYYSPLRELELQGTQLFLGLAHPNDEEGTEKRIALAEDACAEKFGISTECGLGRVSVAELDSVLSIAASVTRS